MMPLSQFNAPAAAVAVPALSRLVDTPERYRRAYCSPIEKIQMISVPGIAWLIVGADWVVVLFLGPRGHGAAVMYSLLGRAGILQPLANSTGWLFISQGRAKEMFRWGLAGRGLTIASFVVWLPWGAVGVAAAYGVACPLVLSPLLFWYVSRHGPVSQADLYGTLKLPALAAAAVALSTLSLRQVRLLADPIVGLAVTIPAAINVSPLVYGIHPRGRKSLAEAGQSMYQTILHWSALPERSPRAPGAAVRT